MIKIIKEKIIKTISNIIDQKLEERDGSLSRAIQNNLEKELNNRIHKDSSYNINKTIVGLE